MDVLIQGERTQISAVLYIPKLGYSLLSVSQLANRGMSFQFGKDKAVLTKGGKRVAIAVRKGKAYVLCAQTQEQGAKKSLLAVEKPML